MQGRAIEMRHVRDIRRLSASSSSHRQIASYLGLARSTVGWIVDACAEAGLTWLLPADLSDTDLEARIFKTDGRSSYRGERLRPRSIPVMRRIHSNVALTREPFAAPWSSQVAAMFFRDFGDTGPCPCEQGFRHRTHFQPYYLGFETIGAVTGEVSLEKCSCGRLWLQIGFEDGSRAARWARGQIDYETARQMTSERAVSYLEEVGEYLCGGPWFGEKPFWRRGKLNWA